MKQRHCSVFLCQFSCFLFTRQLEVQNFGVRLGFDAAFFLPDSTTSAPRFLRITGGVGRLSDVERICADGAEDSDCDDGAALDYRNGRGFGRSISNVSGGGGVGASYYGGGGGPAGGTNHGGIKKSSFRSDSSRGSAARSNGVRFSNGSSAVGPAAGEDGVGRKPSKKKKNDSVSEYVLCPVL